MALGVDENVLDRCMPPRVEPDCDWRPPNAAKEMKGRTKMTEKEGVKSKQRSC